MSSPRIRIQVVAFLFILLPAATGVLAVHASATCERFVRTYVNKPVRNRLSKTTADAWAKWRIAHPNWKPNPKLHRPKYVMTREEAVKKVAFACSVDLIPTDVDLTFIPLDVDGPPSVVDLPPMQATQISIPEVTPPLVAEIPPQQAWPPLAPFVPVPPGPPVFTGTPVVLPPPATVLPEPSSLLLVASGLGGLLLFARRKMRQGVPTAAQAIPAC